MVRAEYERCLKSVGEDIYSSSTTLGLYDVLRAHFLIVDYFVLEGEGLGGVGPRDITLLHSALSRQMVGLGVIQKWTTKFEVCATLLFGLIMDHPFHDANKRTAFLSSLYYLYRMNRVPSVGHAIFENFTVDIADHRLGNYARYDSFVKDGIPDPEVRFISYWLRSNTRNMDKRFYYITYRELKSILNSFDCDIRNPVGNYIDIFMKITVRKGFLQRKVSEEKKVGQIGFPGWGRQVGQGAIKTVRKVCELIPDRGIDSQVFYRGLDDMQSLVAHYQEPLRHLAHR